MLNPFKYIRSPLRKRLKLSVRIRIRAFFFFSVCRSACKERENKLVCGDVRIESFHYFLLYFILNSPLLPFSLCFPAIKRLDGPATSLLYSSHSHGAGLGKVVEEIKHFRFMVRLLVSGFQRCPQTHSLLEKFRWYRTCFVVTWRVHSLLRQHDREKKRKGME